MRKTIVLIVIFLSLVNCRSSKKAKKKISAKEVTTDTGTKDKVDNIYNSNSKPENEFSKAQNIINFANQFKGVRYKWGGTTKSGMDCSGLVYESFRAYEVYLPRISRDMAKKGKKIKLKEVQKGDLLFFKTKNRRNAINHVGLIVDIINNDIKFIHATSSKGVIISGLNETYWNKAFVEARSIL
ncbi:C40 family peptidase [Seonamhaeicola sp. MEBiC1930]|uniref:C40 family peptidase n=1 Tax=Seonamhaeicola sp. MEBiC01930 TaxID=2976768 RepID=UPI00324B8618